MRISSQQMFNIARKSMADVSESVMNTQEQMSTGKRVLTPADDPVASTRILQLTDELSNIDQYMKNIDIAQNNIALEEALLNNVTGIVQRMQELAVAAGNTASLTANEYRAMASEVSTRLDELVNVLNTQNANGDYIFGGYKSSDKPFVGDSLTGFSYRGDEGQQFIKIANNTSLAATDSGKELFVDVDSAEKTVNTYPSPGNQSDPPVQISIGQIVDQAEYEKFYPEDIVITFNADSNLTPPGKNFTATERSTGRVIVANQAHISGEDITLRGVRFKIVGSPESGVPATPATRFFGNDSIPTFTANFTPPNNQSFTFAVGGRTETMRLDANITNVNDLVANLTDVANGNAGRLANLGVTVDSQGFHMPLGVDMYIANGSPAIDAVMGLDSANGSQSNDGEKARPGDRLFIESTEKQGMLTTLARFKEVMSSYDGSNEGKRIISEVVASTLNNLGNAQTSVLEVQSKLGARLNTLDGTRNLHLDTQLVSREIMSNLRDLDYAEAATRLSQQSLILQAAQQSFIRVSQLNLFSRL